MNYAQIRDMDITDGTGIGVALYVSGCYSNCPSCFNKEQQSFKYGNEFTEAEMNKIISLMNRDYINHFSLLGGDPMALPNLETVNYIVKTVKHNYPNKPIWMWTGYTVEELMNGFNTKQNQQSFHYVTEILENIDYLVDGRFVVSLHDYHLKFRGSSNQRILHKENGKWVNISKEFDEK